MKLFDREEKYIGNLKYTLVANHYEEINGEDTLEFTTLDNQVEKGFRVVYKDIYGHWKEFIIKGIEEEKKEDGIIKYVFCESSFYETLGDYIDDKRPSGLASIALLSALEPTRWEVGIVDDLGYSNTNFYRISAKESVHKIAKAWKGEIRTRVEISGNKITHRYVDLLARRGNDLGKRFTYTKDIESIKKTIHRDDVVTALYGYGKGEELESGGYGRRIDFADINLGKAYVENNDARLIWGRNNTDGTKAHIFGKVEFDDCEDKQELLILTQEKLEEVSTPLVTYECKVIDLKAYGLVHEGVELGDTVAIIDKDFTPELRLKARVIAIKRDILEPVNNEIILGNFIPSIVESALEDRIFIENFRNKQGIWDRSNVINQDGSINANILNDLVNELNTRMNSQGGYVYISEDGKGLTTYDKPLDQDPTMAIQILGGSFRIANSKLPNNEWDWRTFGTGEGFVADLITAGHFNGALITAGTITAEQIAVSSESTLDHTIAQLMLSNESFTTRLQSIEANMNFQYMQDTAPENPSIGDVWFSTSNEVFIVNNLLMTVDEMLEIVDYYGNSLNRSYRWDGSNWEWVEDGAITELRQDVSEVVQTSEELSGRVSSTETNLVNLNTRVSSAETKITPTAITNTVESNTTTLAKKSELQQTDEAFTLKFNNLKKLDQGEIIETGTFLFDKDKLRVYHSVDETQYSDVRFDGFYRMWENGEGAYLNDIYAVTNLTSDVDRSSPVSVTVNLPERFRDRDFEIFLSPVAFYLNGLVHIYSDGRANYGMDKLRLVLKEDYRNVNPISLPPYVEISAYMEVTKERAGNEPDPPLYRDLGFSMIVVGY